MQFQIRKALTVAILTVFVLLTTLTYRNMPGDDLASGYIGCRVVMEGNKEALFAHSHTGTKHAIIDPSWGQAGARAGFHSYLNPYVQTPLWAYGLLPLCSQIDYPTFAALFVLIAAASVAGMAFLASRYLAGGASPLVLAAVLAWLWYSLPFKYAMLLIQTHAILMVATLGALILADRKLDISAGFLLAFAAAIKVPPALLVLYWLATRRWRALGWFAAFSAAFAVAAWALAGTEVMRAYLAELRYMSNALIVAYNNHSLPAALMVSEHRDSIGNWNIYPLPQAVKIGCAIMAAFMISTAGVLRQRGASEGATVSIALLSMMMFAPIAWSHYYIVLLVPLVWMLGKRSLIAPAILVALIGLYPHSEVRTLLYAGMIATLTCLLWAASEVRKPIHNPAIDW